MYLLAMYLPGDTGFTLLPDRKEFPSGKARIRHVWVYFFAVLLPFRANCGKGAFAYKQRRNI